MAQKTSLGDRVRRAREARSLSQRELSEAAGLHRSHIPQIEGGGRPHLALSTLQALAKALRVSLDWLVNGEGTGPSKAA